MNEGPPPPHNEAIEQALLGAVLFAGAYGRVAEALKPEHFYDPVHARVFFVAQELAEAGKPITVLTVAQLLGDDPDLAADGGARAYLARLSDSFSTAREAPHYAAEVINLARRRQLVDFADRLEAAARAPGLDSDTEALIAGASAELAELMDGPGGADEASLDAALAAADEVIRRSQGAVNGVSGVATGLIDLDDKLGGLQPSDLIILAGRPSQGKTALALTIGLNAARQGWAARIQSLEMSKARLAMRLYARETGISVQDQRRPLSPHQRISLDEARRRLAGLPLTVDDAAGLTASQIRARARGQKRRGGLDLLIVDYLSHVKATDQRAPKTYQVEEITRTLKQTAKELNVPVLLLAQISRKAEEREDKRPMLADLKDSGAIEQDADVVMFVHREEYYLERADPQRRANESDADYSDRYQRWSKRMDQVRGIGEVIVPKNRQGNITTVRLRFDGQRQVFESLAEGDAA